MQIRYRKITSFRGVLTKSPLAEYAVLTFPFEASPPPAKTCTFTLITRTLVIADDCHKYCQKIINMCI